VGAGSSGAALATRLAEQDPSLQVLLLEAGGSDDVLNIDVPAAAIKLQRKVETDWGYITQPQEHAFGNMVDRRGCWPRGKVLGGSSSLNYMLFVRGAPADFDSWATQGGAGETWNYESVLPYFKRLECVREGDSTVPPSPLRGTEGPMPCNLIISPQPATLHFLEAAEKSGLIGPRNDDYNGSSIYGVGMSQYNVRGGKRCNTATAYVAPALLKRSNLHVLTHAHVQRVLFNAQKEVQGVALKRGTDAATMREQPETFIRARREVILCGGAVGTPQLLELSGLGRRSVLEPLGIPLVHELPGVGENLQDHLAIPVFHESILPTLSGADETLANVWQWIRHGKGPLTGNMVEAMAWFNTRAHSGAGIPKNMPDMQFHFLAGSFAPEDFNCFNIKRDNIERFRALLAGGLKYTTAIMPTLLHPRSRGHVHVVSRSALDAPAIQPNYLSEQADVDSMVEACKVAHKLYAHPALAQSTKRCLTDEMVPNNPFSLEAQPDDYWAFYVRAQANTLYHPVGTAKIGAKEDPFAVVDPQLRVYGVKGLRVADCSVMPHLVSGNTNIPAVMIGERAADLIKDSREGKAPTQQELTAAAPAASATCATNARSKL
jgi:choline dehydrogenase